jgi:hypothetical protein
MAAPGTPKVQRYFASDFDRLQSLVLARSQRLKSVACSTAVLHALSQYRNAVPDGREIDEGAIHEEAKIASSS